MEGIKKNIIFSLDITYFVDGEIYKILERDYGALLSFNDDTDEEISGTCHDFLHFDLTGKEADSFNISDTAFIIGKYLAQFGLYVAHVEITSQKAHLAYTGEFEDKIEGFENLQYQPRNNTFEIDAKVIVQLEDGLDINEKFGDGHVMDFDDKIPEWYMENPEERKVLVSVPESDAKKLLGETN